jgi:hypothetical protein
MDYTKILEDLTIKNELQLNAIELESLVEFMLENIGNPDPYLRDTLIYRGFCKLILEDQLHQNHIVHILKMCLNEQHLTLNIHTKISDDSVFTRSFSALVIALIVYKDTQKREIEETLAQEMIKQSSRYLDEEYDYRGFIEGKGWAHSVAHGADLLTQAILHPLFQQISTEESCLQTIEKCLATYYAYIDEEDERLLNVIDALIKKGLTEEVLVQWLQQLSQTNIQDDHLKLRIGWNKKKFMLTLYMYLVKRNDFLLCRKVIEEIM